MAQKNRFSSATKAAMNTEGLFAPNLSRATIGGG
jgi:hypothetical protein